MHCLTAFATIRYDTAATPMKALQHAKSTQQDAHRYTQHSAMANGRLPAPACGTCADAGHFCSKIGRSHNIPTQRFVQCSSVIRGIIGSIVLKMQVIRCD